MEAYIDHLSSSGLVVGWARAKDDMRPLGLEFWLDGERIGAVKAESFRPDLLEASIGHGHYGFRCQLHPKASWQGLLEIREMVTGQVLRSHMIEVNQQIDLPARRTRPIDSLLVQAEHWSMSDVEQSPGALELEKSLSELGPNLYVAYIYRFLLGRWPGEHEFGHYVPELRRGSRSATEIFQIVMGSDERKMNGLNPCSPFDPEYPFIRKSFSAEPKTAIPPTAIPGFEANSACLSAAILISEPWQASNPQISYNAIEKRLLCHPPASGMTLARIDNIPLAGPGGLAVRASLQNQASAPVDFALLLMPCTSTQMEAEAVFSGHDGAGFSGWLRVTYGGARTLLCERDVGPDGATLYVATRISSDAPGCDNAWAFVSDLVVIFGAQTANHDTAIADGAMRRIA